MQSLSKKDNSSTSFNAIGVEGVKEGSVATCRNEPEDILISLCSGSCSKDAEQCLIDIRQNLFYSHIKGRSICDMLSKLHCQQSIYN